MKRTFIDIENDLLKYTSESGIIYSNAIPLFIWTHVAISVPNSTSTPIFWYNGVSQEINWNGENNMPSVGTYPYQLIGDPSFMFIGELKNVRIFTNVLSNTDVSNIYNNN